MCGLGKQARMIKCPGFTTLEDVQNHCYNPRVRRHKGAKALIKDNPDYYQERDCLIACPNYGPWTACSGAPGQSGMQIRFDLDHVEKYDVKSCITGHAGVMKDPETHFGHCNVACGKGKRNKIVHDFTTGVTSITEEDCEMPDCTAETEPCPDVQVVVSTSAPAAASTTAPTPAPTKEPTIPAVVVSTVSTDAKVTIGATVGTNDVNIDGVNTVNVVIGETINGVVIGEIVDGKVTGDVTNGVVVSSVPDKNIGETVNSVVTGQVVNGVVPENVISGIIIRPAISSLAPEIITATADAITTALSVAFALIALLI
jgi:hypothetical protein